MRKTLVILAAVVSIAGIELAAATKAEARCQGCWEGPANDYYGGYGYRPAYRYKPVYYVPRAVYYAPYYRTYYVTRRVYVGPYYAPVYW